MPAINWRWIACVMPTFSVFLTLFVLNDEKIIAKMKTYAIVFSDFKCFSQVLGMCVHTEGWYEY